MRMGRFGKKCFKIDVQFFTKRERKDVAKNIFQNNNSVVLSITDM